MKKKQAIKSFLVLFVLISFAGKSQDYLPSVDLHSLLQTGYYQDGRFMIDNLQMVFPPNEDPSSLELVIKKGNELVTSVPLRIEPWTGNRVFAFLRPGSGNPGIARVGKEGNFIMSVNLNGKTITSIDFKLTKIGGDDPFNPNPKFSLNGPWNRWGFIAFNPKKEGLMFFCWGSNQELPDGETSGRYEVLIKKNGKIVAEGRKKVSIYGERWKQVKVPLILKSDQPQKDILTKDLLLAYGTCTIEIRSNDKLIKSFDLPVEGGRFKLHPKSNLKYNPHERFISPRLLDSWDYNAVFTMIEATWMEAN